VPKGKKSETQIYSGGSLELVLYISVKSYWNRPPRIPIFAAKTGKFCWVGPGDRTDCVTICPNVTFFCCNCQILAEIYSAVV